MNHAPNPTQAAKVAYVKGAPNDGTHLCHWPGCSHRVAAAKWGCKKHWFLLPAVLRRHIWAAYRPGQEITKTPSREYVAVAKEVQAWITTYEAKKRREAAALAALAADANQEMFGVNLNADFDLDDIGNK